MPQLFMLHAVFQLLLVLSANACGASWGSYILASSGAADCTGCGTTISNYNDCSTAAASGMAALGIGGLGAAETWSGPAGCHIQEGSNFQYNTNMGGVSQASHTPVCQLAPATPTTATSTTASTAARQVGAEYAGADCNGSAIIRAWNLSNFATSANGVDQTCYNPTGTSAWSIRGEWCDFSGAQPVLQGMYYANSPDCSTTAVGYGPTGNGLLADGTCINYLGGTSSRYTCIPPRSSQIATTSTSSSLLSSSLQHVLSFGAAAGFVKGVLALAGLA